MTTFDRENLEQPGRTLHDWLSRWASIEESTDARRSSTLSQLVDLTEQVLDESGYKVGDPVAGLGDEREIVVPYVAARDTAERAELGAASSSEIEQAIADLRDVFFSIVDDTALE